MSKALLGFILHGWSIWNHGRFFSKMICMSRICHLPVGEMCIALVMERGESVMQHTLQHVIRPDAASVPQMVSKGLKGANTTSTLTSTQFMIDYSSQIRSPMEHDLTLCL